MATDIKHIKERMNIDLSLAYRDAYGQITMEEAIIILATPWG